MSAVRFTAKQVLEQIFSNDSDCDEEADEEASEEEDGEEYNPEDEETTEDDDDDDYDAAAADAADDEDDVQVEEGERGERGDLRHCRSRRRRRRRSISPRTQHDIPRVERETFVSRNGQIQWCSVPCDNNRGVGGAAAAAKSNRPVAEVPEDMRPGPTRQAVGQARDILSTFRLFFTPEIEDIILEMTNLEGVRKYGARGDGDDGDDDHRHYADDHENHENHEDRDRGGGGGRWKAMDSTDLRAYVGLLILAGVYRSRGEAASSLWDAESGRTIFRATMPLKVFHAYSRLLRFDDRQTRAERRAAGGGDKLAAVREVWDKWVERLPLLYNPGPDVTVDEQLVPFRGRCPFRQYIPSKPAKYGIKTWVACDSKSSYAWKMQVYTGKATCGGPEKNQGMRVVLDLTQGLRGHNVTCDNFFTSYELARQLLTRNVTVVGTVRKNKPELPQALLASKDRLLFSSKFAFTSTTALVSYLAKKNKNVLLLSTLHTEAHVSRRQDKKPAIVLDYNSNKGGVDNLDKVIGTYSCRRMTARWPLVIFHNILDVSSYNAFVIWRELNPTWMPGKRNKRRVFLEQLGKALVTPFIQRRARLPRTEASAALVKAVQRATYRDQPRRDHAPAAPDHAAPPAQAPNPAQPSKRKRCQVCPTKKDCKTHTVCTRCNKYICKGCSHPYCPTCSNWAFSERGTVRPGGHGVCTEYQD
ncbi:piggyBac transposable element-derived protein 4-like, partial [Coregonus clupeaformis]|uniref:piggyBac transposable element-derived protein 4-like n=1 Tax=Coregonus clupeaformis TaxID=59861 RepID=UPI001E1C6B69